MNGKFTDLFDFEPEENRSVIADNVDLCALKSNDVRDNYWSLLNKLKPPTAHEDSTSKE